MAFSWGVYLLPWMRCRINEIGVTIARKVAITLLVVWVQHGIYGADRDMDETAEKTARIHMMISHLLRVNTFTDEQMCLLKAGFGINA